MFSHVCIGVVDFDRAFAFYSAQAEALGLSLRFVDRASPWAGWQPAEGGRPLFVITAPYDGKPATPGNGQMTAFLAADRKTVDRCHALALSMGATCEGPPGLRPEYHANYYGAYFRDADGNKICVCVHDPLP
ncbi:VOC family protein [Achromobacter piechaudii]|uniref:VOC domain-containing protein n=1 Tax=Achromobacter piechaudii TaxID=72556 RepID=A0ABM8KVB5_9BURK|nr:VOC family protein [Achromobacter piechaudii]CAB3686175.1 hypothetical protein LMG1873_01862 [Achromobacter piechaudii]CAB3866614.1 hypothetical protein LMG2828_02758 [Achromobacter piechaudii]CAB3948742.1 hypothetical protein LMG6103_01982 [Achromobacter piechaudii]